MLPVARTIMQTLPSLAGPIEGVDIDKFFAELRCPYCHGRYARKARLGMLNSGFGILGCACGESPVVDGIAWLSKQRTGSVPRDDPVIGRVLEFLRAGDDQAALTEAILGCSRHWGRRFSTVVGALSHWIPEGVLNRSRRHLERRILRNPTLTFRRAVNLLRNRPYADYLFHRFANPSMLAAIPSILLLKELGSTRATPKRVVEIGGGAGHASFLLRRFFPHLQIVLTDGDFTNLYLAKRFMSPSAVCICLDAETRLPFADQSVDAVFCLDAFHYIRSKSSLSQEVRRIVRTSGLTVVPHLHNSLQSNPAPGFPLEPREYTRVLGAQDSRLFSEADLLRQFCEGLRIDMTNPSSDADLKSASALTYVSGPATLWREHDFEDAFLQITPDLDINRIYTDWVGSDIGPARWPNRDLERECVGAASFLDPMPRVDREVVERLRRGELRPMEDVQMAALIRKFVLVPLPDKYG